MLQLISNTFSSIFPIPSLPLTLLVLATMLVITMYFLPDEHHWP